MRGLKYIKNTVKTTCSSQGICTTVALIYLCFMFLSHNQRGSEMVVNRKELDLVLILCGGQASEGELIASDINRQIRQAEVMLKSAVLFSKKRMHFRVLADSEELFNRLVNITFTWPDNFKRKVKFSLHDIWYPEERKDMRSMFRVCATERLFIPDIFPTLDKAIYIDTDLIFLRPVEDLWAFFNNFNENQIAAMAPCLYHYGTDRNKVPFYGETGLNAGIMHMDLDRMRQIPDGWTDANLAMHDKFASRIKLADQDILNILFHYYPEKLYELPCEWNYRVWLCSEGENKCPGALDNGVSILHGNALAFVKGHEMKIQKIFEAFEDFTLGKDKPGQLFTQIKAGLAQVTHQDMPSKCKFVNGIDKILLNELKNHIAGAKLNRKI